LKEGTLYLLDTNTASYILNGRSDAARRRLWRLDAKERVAISAITEAEIRYGLAKKPSAVRLSEAVEEFLAAIEILPWDSDAARTYGRLRAAMTSAGKSLSAMDMLIAAHAIAVDAVLVSNDGAFRHAKGLLGLVNWATDV
jgi:tRNA(fMet)-specific endonuclease VapC